MSEEEREQLWTPESLLAHLVHGANAEEMECPILVDARDYSYSMMLQKKRWEILHFVYHYVKYRLRVDNMNEITRKTLFNVVSVIEGDPEFDTFLNEFEVS